ncbi:MAG: amidohydrolase family protein [Acidobacteria bacterium]|nr:amidohydrolase family protein [Acidobacteriota bacterium]
MPDDYVRISTEGMTVLPGLWDMHVHLLYAGHTNIQYWHRTYTDRFERETMPATALQLLRAGVTSARDLGAPPAAVFATKRRTAAGEILGPTIYAAGPQLTHEPPDWARFYRRGVSGAAEARAAARALLDAGADVLKITDAESMTVEEVRAITAEAHARGRRVAAHGRTNAEIMIGLEGDVDEFQHIGAAADDGGYPPALLAAIRARIDSGRPLYWTPTVGLPLRGEYLQGNRESLDDPENYAGLPALIADDVKTSLAAFSPRPAPVDTIRRKVSQLRDAGVRLLVGTDAGLAGNFHRHAMWQEMDAWVNVLGIDPLATIHAATGLPASALGVERDAGTLAEGKSADIVVVPGDPLRHISVLRDPAMVFTRGMQVK